MELLKLDSVFLLLILEVDIQVAWGGVMAVNMVFQFGIGYCWDNLVVLMAQLV